MELKIIQKKENPLFKRKEIIAEVEAIITPSTQNIGNLLSKEFSVPQENIKINRIKGKFGARLFNVEASLYDSIIDKEQIETKTKKEREAEKKMRLERMKEAKKAEESKEKISRGETE